MFAIILFVILIVLITITLIKVMVYGRGILRPDFERADEMFSKNTGFHFHGITSWNSPFGKTVYYLFLTGFVFLSVLSIVIFIIAVSLIQ